MIALTNSLMTSMPNEKASAYHSIQEGLKHRDRLVFHKVGIITKSLFFVFQHQLVSQIFITAAMRTVR